MLVSSIHAQLFVPFVSFHFWCHSALTTVITVNRDDGMITSWRDVGGDNNAIKQEGALLLQAHVNTLIMTSAHGPHVLRHHVACTTHGGLARQWDFMRRHACMIMYGWPWIHEHHRSWKMIKNQVSLTLVNVKVGCVYIVSSALVVCWIQLSALWTDTPISESFLIGLFLSEWPWVTLKYRWHSRNCCHLK